MIFVIKCLFIKLKTPLIPNEVRISNSPCQNYQKNKQHFHVVYLQNREIEEIATVVKYPHAKITTKIMNY